MKLNDLANKIWFTSSMYFIFFTAMQLTNWMPIKYWDLRGEGTNFIDTESVINSINCYKEVGDQIFAAEGYCSGYIYGKILPVLFTLGPERSYLVSLVGYVFLLLISIVLGFTTASIQNNQIKTLSILVFLSPPILLLAERGNFDTVMVALTFYGALLLSQNRNIFAFIVLAITSLIKFYTFPVLFIFLLKNIKRKFNYLYLLGIVPIFLLVYEEIRLIKSAFPSASSYKFGMSIWIRYLPDTSMPFNLDILANVVGLLLFVAVGLFVLIKYKFNSWSSNYSKLDLNLPNVYIFKLLFMVHAVCFFSGMSYDYRLIFLAISGIYFLSLKVMSMNAEFMLKSLLVLSMWLSFPSGGLQPFGDLAICALTFVLSYEFLKLNAIRFGSSKLFKVLENDI